MRFVRTIAALAVLLLIPLSAAAQTWPADGDWAVLMRNSAPIDDVEGDVTGSRDIVGDATNPAGYVWADASHLYFRIRLNEDPRNTQGTALRSFSWGVEFDTNADTDNFEALVMVNGVANPNVVSLQENTTQGTVGDPSDSAETELQTYPFSTNGRVVMAASTFSADADFFLDFTVPWADLASVGVTPGGTFGLILGSGNSANALASDIGTTIAAEVSDPNTCTVMGCNLPPAQPTLDITTPADGATIAETNPMIGGTSSELGLAVAITVDGGTADEQIGTATTDAATGHWSFAVVTALADGAHTVEVRATAGATMLSDSVTFTVDTTLPALGLSVDAPADGSTISDSTPTFSGVTGAGATVTVVVDGQTYVATANGTGNWTLDVTNELADGPQVASVVANDGAVTSPEVTVMFTVDTTPPDLAVTTPTDGMVLPGAFTVSGTAEPGAMVEVWVDEVLVGTVTAGEDGTWTVDVPEEGELASGEHTLGVTATDLAGNEASVALSVTVEAAPTMPATDTDEDGLPDDVEAIIGTDPNNPDTDGDGISDGEEFDGKTNPFDADTDGDGLTDPEELNLGTDPRLVDTDHGGVFDGNEIDNGTDPLNPDDDRVVDEALAGRGCSAAGGGHLSPWLLLFGLGLFARRRR